MALFRADEPPPVSIFRWDLDKTYLRSEFGLRDMVRVPFERALDKVEVPAVPEVIRSLKSHARERGRRALVYFVSASPPQIGQAIVDKFLLDGVEIDGIVFKDQLASLMRGKWKSLREHVGYKLVELLRARTAAPAASIEYLFGDDWESDPMIYTIYSGVLEGRLEGEALARLLAVVPVDRALQKEIERLAAEIPRGDVVRRIFINLERETPPARLRPFGPLLVPTFNYLQTAACLFEDGEIDAGGVAAVARRLVEKSGFTEVMLENSLDDVLRRGHLGEPARRALGRVLRRARLLPIRSDPLMGRMRRMGRTIKARLGSQAVPLAEEAATDYEALLADWRARASREASS